MSVKPTPVSGIVAVELVIVNVSSLVPPSRIGEGENALEIAGAAGMASPTLAALVMTPAGTAMPFCVALAVVTEYSAGGGEPLAGGVTTTLAVPAEMPLA